MKLGDLTNDDASYTGVTDAPVYTLQYYRDKATQFQAVLNAVDAAAQAAQSAIDAATPDIGVGLMTGDWQSGYGDGADTSPDVAATISDSTANFISDMQSALADYDGKKTAFRLAAEGLNAGAAAINAAGGRFPSLSIPQSLGAIQIPIVLVATIAAVATLIAWGNQWIAGVNDRLRIELQNQQSILAANAITDPAAKNAMLARISGMQAAAAQVQSASDSASGSPLSSIASIVQWGAIGLAVYLLWREFGHHFRGDD